MPELIKTPFDLIYEKLVDELRADGAFSAKPKNVVEFSSAAQTSSPERPQVQTADLPEVLVYMQRVYGNLHGNSSAAHFTTVWRYLVSTGEHNSRLSFRLVFNILRMHKRWKEVFGELQWREDKFVRNARIVDVQHGISDPQANRNIKGFSAVLDFELDISLLNDNFILGL